MAAPTAPEPTLPVNAAVEGLTERFDPIQCLDERVRSSAAAGTENLAPGRYLEVQGPDRTLVIALTEGTLRIGRGLSADIRLDEASVSRRHAILETSAPARVLDDRSSNGTFVNGERVERAELLSGDEITIGRVNLRYVEVP